MEEIDGGKLSGSVQGVPVGDVKLVPGKRGLVLYVNGIDQRVNLGNQHHNCMGDLTKSHNGFLMAMWIQVHNDDDTEFYISNRGQTRRSIGVAFWLQDTKIGFGSALRRDCGKLISTEQSPWTFGTM